VALYGTNLVMSTIGASLQENPEFQVQQIEGTPREIMDKLETAPPDVILFDLAAAQPDFVISLLRKHPTVMIIGVDLTSNNMIVLSGEHSRLLTTEDLVQAIKRCGLKEDSPILRTSPHPNEPQNPGPSSGDETPDPSCQ